MQCKDLDADVERASGPHAAASYLLFSYAAKAVLADAADMSAAAHEWAAHCLDILPEPPFTEAELDAALADVRPDVPLAGRQLVLTVLAVDARPRLQLASDSEQHSPAQRAAGAAAAESCVRRLLAEDPLRTRHYSRLMWSLILQGRQREAHVVARTQLEALVREKGGLGHPLVALVGCR